MRARPLTGLCSPLESSVVSKTCGDGVGGELLFAESEGVERGDARDRSGVVPSLGNLRAPDILGETCEIISPGLCLLLRSSGVAPVVEGGLGRKGQL